MKNIEKTQNPYFDDKVIDACSIFGMMDTTGKRFSGKNISRAIANMHVRGNGLGGGFAVYGLYPEYADFYAFHVMYLSQEGKDETEYFIKQKFHVIYEERIPTKPVPAIVNSPLIWRYFVEINLQKDNYQAEEDYIVDCVMKINTLIKDAFVFSSGKNMGVFKGVGYPEEIAEYLEL